MLYPFITRFSVKLVYKKQLTLKPISGIPKGIRTPVTAVKGRCPRPLDDRDTKNYLFQNHLKNGGAMRDRTADLFAASEALSQLSYSPMLFIFYYTGLIA